MSAALQDSPAALDRSDTRAASMRCGSAWQVAVFLAICLLAAAVPAVPRLSGGDGAAAGVFPGWPESFGGLTLVEVPLTSMERRFYSSMPGRVARFTDGHRQLVFRWLGSRDPKFHLSQRCYRAFGYGIEPRPALIDDSGQRWGVFEASRAGETMRVRERIWDAAGNEWTDEAAFRWDMFWRRSDGPWWAVTIAEKTQAGAGQGR